MDSINDRIAMLVSNNERTKTKTDFAKVINISQPFLSQICSGARDPSNRTIADICREFCINEKWLRTGEGEMKRNDTHREQLENFFSDVLSSAPDKRSALIAALSTLPRDFWDMIADLAEAYAASLSQLPNEEKED